MSNKNVKIFIIATEMFARGDIKISDCPKSSYCFWHDFSNVNNCHVNETLCVLKWQRISMCTNKMQIYVNLKPLTKTSPRLITATM